MNSRALGVLVAVVLLVGGCGGEDPTDTAAVPEGSTVTEPSEAPSETQPDTAEVSSAPPAPTGVAWVGRAGANGECPIISVAEISELVGRPVVLEDLVDEPSGTACYFDSLGGVPEETTVNIITSGEVTVGVDRHGSFAACAEADLNTLVEVFDAEVVDPSDVDTPEPLIDVRASRDMVEACTEGGNAASMTVADNTAGRAALLEAFAPIATYALETETMGDLPAVGAPVSIEGELFGGADFEVVGARCVALDPLINGPMVTVFGRIGSRPMHIAIGDAQDPLDPLYEEGLNARVWSWQVNAKATSPEGISVTSDGARLDNVTVEGTSEPGSATISLDVAC